jgi:hypothetical protein
MQSVWKRLLSSTLLSALADTLVSGLCNMPETKWTGRIGKAAGFLHDHLNFPDLIRQVGQ